VSALPADTAKLYVTKGKLLEAIEDINHAGKIAFDGDATMIALWNKTSWCASAGHARTRCQRRDRRRTRNRRQRSNRPGLGSFVRVHGRRSVERWDGGPYFHSWSRGGVAYSNIGAEGRGLPSSFTELASLRQSQSLPTWLRSRVALGNYWHRRGALRPCRQPRASHWRRYLRTHWACPRVH